MSMKRITAKNWDALFREILSGIGRWVAHKDSVIVIQGQGLPGLWMAIVNRSIKYHVINIPLQADASRACRRDSGRGDTLVMSSPPSGDTQAMPHVTISSTISLTIARWTLSLQC